MPACRIRASAVGGGSPFGGRDARCRGGGLDQENRRPALQIGRRAAPLCDCFRSDLLAWQGELHRKAQQRVVAARVQNSLQQPGVAVRCFDEQMSAVSGSRLRLQIFERARASVAIYRQVAVEAEALAVQPRCHQGEQQGGRPDQRHHSQALAMRQRDQRSARIGDGGASGLGQHADALSGAHRRQECGQRCGRRVLVELRDRQLAGAAADTRPLSGTAAHSWRSPRRSPEGRAPSPAHRAAGSRTAPLRRARSERGIARRSSRGLPPLPPATSRSERSRADQ